MGDQRKEFLTRLDEMIPPFALSAIPAGDQMESNGLKLGRTRRIVVTAFAGKEPRDCGGVDAATAGGPPAQAITGMRI